MSAASVSSPGHPYVTGFPLSAGQAIIKASTRYGKVPKIPKAGRRPRGKVPKVGKHPGLGVVPRASGGSITGASTSTTRVGY